MPQDRRNRRSIGHVASAHLTKLHAAFVPAALLGLVVAFNATIARAGDNGADESFFSRTLEIFGLKDSPEIKYMERSPLVVPPTRDLPPPGAAPAAAPDWPRDPTGKPHKHAKPKPEPIPVATAAAATANASAAQSQQPAPKKSFSLFGWFNKEEYARFTGEPPREDLTDPPAGYRTPSPDEPYGIGPEKKGTKAQTAGSGSLVPISTGNGAGK